MNKQEIYQYLNDRGIHYEITEHKAVYNMADLADVEIPYPEADAKNLFLHDDKKKQYYLVMVRGDKKVNLKEFRRQNQTRPLSFASEEELMQILHLIPGAVTPFGLLNDENRQVKFYLDDYFLEQSSLIGCHPNDNTATIWLKSADLVQVLEDYGTEVHIVTV